mgnify:CR=1 FL=1
MEEHIDEDIAKLDYNSLLHLSRWHQKQANLLRKRIDEIEYYKGMNERSRERVDFLARMPQYVRRHLRRGLSLEEAIDATHTDTGVKKYCIRQHWKDYIRSKNENDIALRNQLILDLAALNMTHSTIGQRLGLHRKSVARIIQQERRQRQQS